MEEQVGDGAPSPPEWLDKTVIEKALRAGDEDTTINVVTCEIQLANTVSEGFASDMYRAKAQLEDGTTRSVIVKCHPRGGMREKYVKDWDAFTIEHNMLANTLPAMSKLLEKARPGKYPPFAARCFYHEEEPTEFLVLEDLKTLDFTMAKRQQGVDLNHCFLIIKTLARLHAASVALHDLNPAAVECYVEGLYRESMKEYLEAYLKGALKSLVKEVETWPEYNEKYGEKLRNLESSISDRLVEVCLRQQHSYNALIHGDPWTNNMMFKYADGEVTDVRLVDFQNTVYTSPALDIHYFLSTCPNVEVRKIHIEKLLLEYTSELNSTLEDLGCSKHHITMEGIRQEMDERLFFEFYASISVLPIVLSNPEDGFNAEESLKGDSDKLASQKKIYSNEMFKNVIKTLLPKLENKGFFQA